MAMAQLAGRNSLRDIVENVSAQAHRLYHLGSAKLTRCQGVAPGHDFCFKNLLYSLDASTIDLCLPAFPWAVWKSAKGAIKLHVGLNHAGYLPEFVLICSKNEI